MDCDEHCSAHSGLACAGCARLSAASAGLFEGLTAQNYFDLISRIHLPSRSVPTAPSADDDDFALI